MLRRNLLAMVSSAALGAAIGLAPCGGCNPVARRSVGRREVLFWHFWGGSDLGVVEGIVRRFNDSQSAHRVRAIAMPGNNLDLKFFLSVVGRDPPDLLNQDDPIVADWAHRGALAPIDEVAPAGDHAAMAQGLLPTAHRLGQYRGRTYAVANGLDIRALYYNATWLEELGIAPPRSIAQLDQLAERVAPTPAPRLERVGFLPDPRRIWSWGAAFGAAFDREGVPTPDDPNMLTAMRWMAGYAARYGPDRVAAFSAGDQALAGAQFPLLAGRRYASILDGQWRLRDLAKHAAGARTHGKEPDRFGVVPLPLPEGGRPNAGWVNGNFFVLPRRAKNPRGAWEFIKFWCGAEGNAEHAAQACIEGGWIPVLQSVIDHPRFQASLEDRPLMRSFLAQAASPNQLPTPAIPIAPFYYRELIAAAEDVVYRGAEPQARLGRCAARVREQFARVER